MDILIFKILSLQARLRVKDRKMAWQSETWFESRPTQSVTRTQFSFNILLNKLNDLMGLAMPSIKVACYRCSVI